MLLKASANCARIIAQVRGKMRNLEKMEEKRKSMRSGEEEVVLRRGSVGRIEKRKADQERTSSSHREKRRQLRRWGGREEKGRM